MKYIIADPDEQSRIKLKNILGSFTLLVFQGSFTTYEAAENSIRGKPPDIAFIKLGEAELNAYSLARAIRAQNPLTKVIFMSIHKEDAVEAFEYGADGFVLLPFDEKNIRQVLKGFIAINKLQIETI